MKETEGTVVLKSEMAWMDSNREKKWPDAQLYQQTDQKVSEQARKQTTSIKLRKTNSDVEKRSSELQ